MKYSKQKRSQCVFEAPKLCSLASILFVISFLFFVENGRTIVFLETGMSFSDFFVIRESE